MKTEYRILEYSNCFTIQTKTFLFWWDYKKYERVIHGENRIHGEKRTVEFVNLESANHTTERLKNEELNRIKYPILHNIK